MLTVEMSCDAISEKTILGEYHNLKSDGDMTIKETMGWDQVEYVLTELGYHRLGRFDQYTYVMRVFKNIHPDNIDCYLKFSEDFNLAYTIEGNELLYIKKKYFNSLSKEELEDLQKRN